MISILTDKPSYRFGETIHATIEIKLGKPTKARGVVAELACEEETIHKTTVVIDKYNLDREHELGVPYSGVVKTEEEKNSQTTYDKDIVISGEGTYHNNTIETKIPIPSSGRPTSHEYGHDNRIVVWTLSVKLDIPMWPDEGAEKEVFIEGAL